MLIRKCLDLSLRSSLLRSKISLISVRLGRGCLRALQSSSMTCPTQERTRRDWLYLWLSCEGQKSTSNIPDSRHLKKSQHISRPKRSQESKWFQTSEICSARSKVTAEAFGVGDPFEQAALLRDDNHLNCIFPSFQKTSNDSALSCRQIGRKGLA